MAAYRNRVLGCFALIAGQGARAPSNNRAWDPTIDDDNLIGAVAPEIARVELPGDDLFQRLKSQDVPLILTGALKDWKAISKWNITYLVSVLGTTKVNVEVSPTNYFPTLCYEGSDNGGKRHGLSIKRRRSRQVPFNGFAETILRPNNGPVKFYLKEKAFIEKFPDLAADIPLQSSLSATKHFPTLLWISSADITTPLHYDVVHSLFAQVSGRKRFTLFAPQDGSSLYPFPVFSRNSYLSRVDILQPDVEEFPKFRQAKPFEFVLEPGEVLYLPAFWWHQVQSLDVAISISFYRHLSARQILKWQSLRARPAALAYILDNIAARVGRGRSESAD